MNVLPAAGPERTRVMALVALLAIAGAVWYYNSSTAVPLPVPAATGRTASNPSTAPRDTAAAKTASRQAVTKPTTPEPLKLAELEKVLDEPNAGRNPFRFGVTYVAPPPTPPPVYTPPPIVTPPPPPAPEVKLRLEVVIDDPYGKKRAYLVDPTGAMFEAVDGQVVDGRYRVVKIEKNSAIVEFLNGTGRRTLFVR